MEDSKAWSDVAMALGRYIKGIRAVRLSHAEFPRRNHLGNSKRTMPGTLHAARCLQVQYPKQ